MSMSNTKEEKNANMDVFRLSNESAHNQALSPVRNYKDTVFRMLFCDKEELLVLYNAVNGTNYSDPDALQITTLDSAVYMSMKNDISFVLDTKLSLYEHQSTVNRNMPLRDLMYVTKIFEGLVIHKDLYSSKLIRLPSPRFITFYNGAEKQPERREYYLSDAYEVKDSNPALELIVTQLNINPGYNTELMEKCPTLYQYMLYVEKIRSYEQYMTLAEAVEKTVDECIHEGILAEFLLKNKAKVTSMTIFEFDQELHNRTLYEEGHEDGFIKGEESGMLIKLISQISRKLQKGKSPEQISDDLEEDFDLIKEICECAVPFAPEYDPRKICEAMLEKKVKS